MTQTSTEIVAVHITVETFEEASKIARHLVEERLAACVHQHAITSTYRWEDKVVRGEEIALVAKTARALFPKLEKAVLGLHSYDVPEIVCLPVAEGHQPYLQWVATETG